MGRYEVTQAQYQEVMGSNPSYFKNCDQCPVEQVSWNDAQEFIRRMNAVGEPWEEQAAGHHAPPIELAT